MGVKSVASPKAMKAARNPAKRPLKKIKDLIADIFKAKNSY
jgi:hypothetical protein